MVYARTYTCAYFFSSNELKKQIFAKNTHFKVLGFNAESISSKIDSIKLFQETLKQKNIILDAICINECWLEDFGDDLNLTGYTAYPLTKKTGSKGGLIVYLLEDYIVKDLNLYIDSKSWEGQFLEVQGNGLKSKLLLNNLYVPPRTSTEFTIFTNDFLPIANSLTNKYKHMIVIADTNADALQCNSSSLFLKFSLKYGKFSSKI